MTSARWTTTKGCMTVFSKAETQHRTQQVAWTKLPSEILGNASRNYADYIFSVSKRRRRRPNNRAISPPKIRSGSGVFQPWNRGVAIQVYRGKLGVVDWNPGGRGGASYRRC